MRRSINLMLLTFLMIVSQAEAANIRSGGGGGSSSSSSNGACWEIDVDSNLMPVSGACTDTNWEQDGNGDLEPQ